MNNYQIFLLTLFETTSFMLIFSIFNKDQKKLFFKNGIIIVFSSLFVLLSNTYFPDVGNFINYIIMIVLIVIIYINKCNLYETILEFCISLFLIILLQLLLTTILKLILLDNIYTFANGIVINSILLFISLIVYFKFPMKEKYKLYKSIIGQHTFKILIFNSIIYIICFKLLWEYNKSLVLNYIIIFVLIFLSSNLANFILANQIIKLTDEKRSIEVSSIYSSFVEEMISEIKRKQHEFKNHLNAIYGICYTTDEELIKENVSEYVKSIDCSLINIDESINIDNKILAAVIYSKLCEAKAKNIKFSYSIKNKLDNIKLKEYELVEILSDLINNAFEYLELNNISERVVYVRIGKDKNINFIDVGNFYIYTDNFNINLIFEKGFSTKGKNRGYGLYNIKRIVENSGGKIQLFFENNHIIFRVLF